MQPGVTGHSRGADTGFLEMSLLQLAFVFGIMWCGLNCFLPFVEGVGSGLSVLVCVEPAVLIPVVGILASVSRSFFSYKVRKMTASETLLSPSLPPGNFRASGID